MLCAVPRVTNSNVLVGFDTADDAGVYLLDSNTALVQTVDFFTPIVDDPATFGAIAAANSLSDVYAMGGRPISALSIVAFPAMENIEILKLILTGGAEKMREAGCAILGGHSINDEEIKFGYAVTGTVKPDAFWTNAAARPGDVLLLTKSIGTGVISTAHKRGVVSEHHLSQAVASMLMLNRAAAEACAGLAVHSCTDVTGFGLAGHAREMAVGSQVTIEIETSRVPLLDGSLEYTRAGSVPGGLRNNREFAMQDVQAAPGIDSALFDLMFDPQTSGGLLVSLPESDAAEAMVRFPRGVLIGRVVERRDKALHFL